MTVEKPLQSAHVLFYLFYSAYFII